LAAEVDLSKLAETLARRAEKTQAALASLEKKLSNPGFLAGADPEVVANERARGGELAAELSLLRRNLEGLA
jgi:valyl-tRNA synthetase